MPLSETDLIKARSNWGKEIIKISKAYEDDGIERASLVALKMLDNLYGFNLGPVLFKPTLSGGDQTFRLSKAAALSYFVGHNTEYPLDTGFGIKHWREFKSETAAVFIDESIAMWMGWVTLTDANFKKVKVDKSWGYKLDGNGTMRIVLHHSSLPYEP